MARFRPFLRNQNNQGFNLIEASIVLGIVGLIVGGIFAAWSSVSAQERVKKGADMITVIVQQVRTAYASRTTFDSTDQNGANFTAALIAANLIPVGFISGGNLKNPWNGNILVTPDANGMNINFTNVNLADCQKLVAHVLGAARSQGLSTIDSATGITNTTVFSGISGNVCGSTTVNFYFRLRV